MWCGTHAPPARPSTGARNAPAGDVRSGHVADKCSPSTHPETHREFTDCGCRALALGYRVAIRPSRREPFTAHRLIMALRRAGFRPEDAVYLPTDHAGADEIIAAADLAMVYGGQDVVDKYADDPKLITNGPGRTWGRS